MPAYAVLGATGTVGQSLLNFILQSPTNGIHAYCRSSQKLKNLSPSIATNKQVKIFDGSLQDTSLLANRLQGTNAAFLAIAEVKNKPGCSIAQETAHAVVSALSLLRKQNGDQKLPRLVVLSSASLDHSLMSPTPAFILNILYRANSHIYDDLRAAENFLLSKENESLVSATFVRPGALSHDTQKGHYLSLEKAEMPLSFLDLAAGMLEIAEDEEEKWNKKGVAVSPTAKDVPIPWVAPFFLLTGLLFHFFSRGRIDFWGDLVFVW
ncbi:hypothetical protein DL98DRAFT_523966 [Cadophora sp. DSE1049]|nr:hypothetical protein DL98DRAFT_523966 [Cadophora sp. DSE1049]